MLRRSLGQIILLAVVGLGIVTVLGAGVLKGILEPSWDWPQCFLMASILSATDPVAVVALMRQNSAPDQIITLMEGESLLNDGFAMVAFLLCIKLVEGEPLTVGSIVGAFAFAFAF
jgi:NhaP-type Na+/H+ or K+/H+ antiporter